MAEAHDIRSAFFDEGKTISEIAKDRKIDRKTVRKYINQENWQEEKPLEAIPRESILDAFTSVIDEWLHEDRRQRRKQRHTAKRVYDRLVEEHGFPGSYRTVAAYVAEKKRALGKDSKSALPLEHIPGEAQVDFGEADCLDNGTLVHGSYVSVSFPYSNGGFLQLTPGQNAECLFSALIAIFFWIGGVPTRLWFDNTSVAVKKILRDGERELTDRFRRFQEHFGFQVAFCNPASGHEKGSVENKVGYHRRNFLVPIPEFQEFDAYNEELLSRCDQDNQRAHYRKERLIAELFADDQVTFLKLPRIEFDPSRYERLRADAYGMIGLEQGRHRYSTSPRFAGEHVTVQIAAQKVVILDENLRPVVVHKRLYGNGKQESMDWLPYLSTLARRPGALKYTAVYEMMPEVLKSWIDAQPRQQVGTALGLLASLTRTSSFNAACNAVSEAIGRGVTDADSLVALHDRMTRYSAFCEPLTAPQMLIDAPAVSFDPERYNAMLLGDRR